VKSLEKDPEQDTVSNISHDSAIKSSIAGDSVAGENKKKTSMTGSTAEPIPQEKVIEYLTLARERFILDQKYFAKLAEEEKLMAMAAKRNRRMNQMDEARKMMLEFSRDAKKKEKEEEAARAEEKRLREERGGDEDESSVKSASSATTATSVTDSNASTESISIAKLKRNRFMFMKPEVARFTDKEMEVLPDLLWFKLTIQHSEFFDCCKELPLVTDKLVTRDELVQFAKLCSELSPFTLKAKDRLKKKREEVLNQKALKRNRFRPTIVDKGGKAGKPAELDTEEEAAIRAKEEYRKLLSDGLAEEAEKRKIRLKAAQKRRKRREKAWLYAHQHMFIKVQGKAPFCVICRDKMDMQWLDTQESHEKKHNDDWEGLVAADLNNFQFEAKKMVEAEYLKEMEEAKKNPSSTSASASGAKSSESSTAQGGSLSLPGLSGTTSLKEPTTIEPNSDSDSNSDSSSKCSKDGKEADDQKSSLHNNSSRSMVDQGKHEKTSSRSALDDGDNNSEKNTTPSSSTRQNVMKGLSARLSKSASTPSDVGSDESESASANVSASVSIREDKDTFDDSNTKNDDTIDDLSRVSESKSELSKDDSLVSFNNDDSVVLDSSKTHATEEVFFAGKSEAADLSHLQDVEVIKTTKDFAQDSTIITKGYGKNMRIDRGRTRRKGVMKAAIIPLPDYMIAAGLAAIDPNGLKHVAAPTVVAPVEITEEQAKKAKQLLSRKKSSVLNDSEDGSVDPDRLTVFDKFKHEILLKVWNYNSFDDKGDSLGYIVIPNEFIANPTKGIRKFPLMTDPSLVKPSGQNLTLHGDVFCKLIPTRKTDVRINKPSDKPKTRRMNSFNEEPDSDSDVSSNDGDSKREEPAPKAAVDAESEPPKVGMLQRFMGTKKVNTTVNMIDSPNEEKAIIDVKAAKKKKEAEEAAAAEFQGPCNWKFQILKGVKMTCIDRVDKSSPIIEVCWKGNTMKKNDIVYEKDFQTVGYTSVKKNTVDPDWKGDDSAIFEFPPVWTTANLPGRGESLKETLKGGGYVAKNKIPDNDPILTRKFGGSVLLKMKSEDVSAMQSGLLSNMNKPAEPVKANPLSIFKRAATTIKITNSLGDHTIENLDDKMAFKTKVRKALLEAEEIERKCMAREERRTHIHFRETATEFEAPFLTEQKLYEKNFSRLMQHLQNSPPILGRVRFLMSHLMKGGGTCTMCQDPATHKNVDVYAIPIMYDEDEDELDRQVQVMLGRQHNSIIQILNFSVHQVLGFSMSGYASLNERVAMVVCNKEPSVSLLEHIQESYYSFTDNDFRVALMQITNALMSVHRDGLVHRNIHPDCVHIKIKGNVKAIGEDNDDEDDEDDEDVDSDEEGDGVSVSTKQSLAASANSSSSKSLRNRPTYVLEDFWFLHNPRKAGCEFSMGRADWGNAQTVPPEALNGNIITEKSDIWGLGISVYMWATRGLVLNVQDGKKFDFNEIAKNIPLKWGPWVLSLLRMCLERNPKYRASANDLYSFLLIAKPISS
jgi:serine/threonine protein kinase